MVVQSGVSSASPADDEKETSRLHIRSIKEMPAGHDAELATIFKEMRRAADVPLEKMAARLKTSVETVGALENGAINALPPWPELSRVVTAYTAILGLDSRPLLRRLEAQLSPDAGLTVVTPPQKTPPAPAPSVPNPASAAIKSAPAPAASQAVNMSGAPVSQPAASPVSSPQAPPPQAAGERVQPRHAEERAVPLPTGVEAPQKPKSGIVKAALNWLVLIGFVAALGGGVWYAAQHPHMVWSAVDALPAPVPRAVRSAWKFMRPLEGEPARQKLPESGSRKSDKLP